eukprot:2745-Prymnesium_polylepis.1
MVVPGRSRVRAKLSGRAETKARMASLIQLCNVLSGATTASVGKKSKETPTQLVRAAFATLTVCRVSPDAMRNICSLGT